MPLFSDAIAQLTTTARYQKALFPKALREVLARGVDEETLDVDYAMIITLFIMHQASGVTRYQWLPALSQFNHAVQAAIAHQHGPKRDELICVTQMIIPPADVDQRLCGEYILFKAGIFNALNQEAIQGHPMPYALARSLYLLKDSRLLDQQSFDFLLAHPNLADLTQAILALSLSQLMNRANWIQLIRNYQNGVGYLLREMGLLRIQMLQQDNFDCILSLSAESVICIVRDLECLSRVLSPSAEHFSLLMNAGQYRPYDSKADLFNLFYRLNLLTADRALLLLDPRNTSGSLFFIYRFLSPSPHHQRVINYFLSDLLTNHAGHDVAELLRLTRFCIPDKHNIKAFIQQSKVHRLRLIQIVERLLLVDTSLVKQSFFTQTFQTVHSDDSLDALFFKAETLLDVKRLHPRNVKAVSAYPIHLPVINRYMMNYHQEYRDKLFIILRCLEGVRLNAPTHNVFFIKRHRSLLNQMNLDRVLKHRDPIRLANILSCLCLNENNRWPLTQRDLNVLLEKTDLVHTEYQLNRLCCLPQGLLSQSGAVRALLRGLPETIGEEPGQEEDMASDNDTALTHKRT